MARVRTFTLSQEHSIPDKEIQELISEEEKNGFVRITTTFIPAPPSGGRARLNVIITKLDEYES